MDKDSMRIGASFERLKKTSGRVQAILKFLLLAYTICAAIVLVVLINGVDLSVLSPVEVARTLSPLFSFVITYAVGAVLLVIFMRMFGDISQGQSPFVGSQSSRFKVIGCLLVLKTIFEFLMSMLPAASAHLGDISTSVSISVDLSSLLWACTSFALSYVFKYGSLLQELSDSTF